MYINGGQVDFSGCSIFDNEAGYVRPCHRRPTFHGPHGSSFQEVSLALAGRRCARLGIQCCCELYQLPDLFEHGHRCALAPQLHSMDPAHAPFHCPHGISVPELTMCLCDAMSFLLTRRCRMYAATRYASFHGPHGSSYPELTPCPCDAMPRLLTRGRSMYAAARYAPFHGPHGSSFQEASLALAGRRRVRR